MILLSKNGLNDAKAALGPLLADPGAMGIPIAFMAAFLGMILSKRDLDGEAKFTELSVRAQTGLGGDQASSHQLRVRTSERM